ncbi:MAG TPA: glycosyltransferase family 4 protein [Polyangiaceae bacterium]|nr:glycosyltransferase family 4 protein [Polyangiaceae bacterium]
MERNEVDATAMGGTELMGAGLERHVDPQLLGKFQIIRSRVRELDPTRKHVLWLHDLPGDPESEHLREPASRSRFEKIVMVSNWQMQQYKDYLGVPYSDCVVLRNAIEPIPNIDKTGDEIRLIYHPTPHRGLQILVPVFERLCNFHDDIRLDVFSSFKLYGWEERDEQFESLIQRCKDHPKIDYHGTQPNDVVREALAKAHVFAYPSIWRETSCLCAMEAMSAAALIVAPNYAGLPETTAGFAMMYQWDEDINRHAVVFFNQLNNAIVAWKQQRAGLTAHLDTQKAYADNMYSWQRRAAEWTNFLTSLA